MKRCYVLVVTVALLLGLVACGNAEKTAMEEEGENVTGVVTEIESTEDLRNDTTVTDAITTKSSTNTTSRSITSQGRQSTSQVGTTSSVAASTAATSATTTILRFSPTATTTVLTTTATTCPATTTCQTTSTTAEKPTTASTATKTESDIQEEQTVTTNNYEEMEKQAFCRVYESEKDLYVFKISVEIDTLTVELQEWRTIANNNAAEYYAQQRVLREQYAGMGLLNSGAYQNALLSLEQNYKNNNRECTEKIQSLTARINELKAEMETPSSIMVLTQITTKYSITIEEAIVMYNKYIA